jgi:exosome complex component RRP45
MKETALSSNEKTFVESAIKEGLRIDKRQLDEFRDLSIFFVSKDFGSVIVSLGDTKIFACVSCEVNQPKTSRPNEGTVFVNVEIGPMAAPHFEVGSSSEVCIFVNRILERTIRDSRCIDMESLCIIAEEKVWNLRVDVTVLNHEGNIVGEF